MNNLFNNVHSAVHSRPHVTEENRLNLDRFTKYVAEFQQLLEDADIKRALGSVATAWLRGLSELLVPVETKNNVLRVSRSKPTQLKIPLRFVDDTITIDSYQVIKGSTLVKSLPIPMQHGLEEGIRKICKKEFMLGHDNSVGYAIEYYDRQPIVLLYAGLSGANMASTMCHELIHAWQIVGRLHTVEDLDDDTNASGELEAYHYQALFDKGLQQMGAADYSIFGISGLAQKINFIRTRHARATEPYTVTPKMKQELISRGFGPAIFPSLRQDAIEKTD